MSEQNLPPPSDSVTADKARFLREVNEARLLLEYAVAEGKLVDDKVLDAIKKTEDSARKQDIPSAEERAFFEKAYRDLAKAMSPVTAATLAATSDEHGQPSTWLAAGQKISEAKRWSRLLWMYTSGIVLFTLAGEILDHTLTKFFPVDEDTEGAVLGWQIIAAIFTFLIPFTYGALGSLTYLLRSCHEHIYKRQFDPNRIPEYYNRILLGIISGGTILLFVENLMTDSGPIQLSAKSLGFLAGYNTDFLFTTLERVAQAILPKVGIESVARRKSAGTEPDQLQGGVKVIEGLLEQYKKAQDPAEKAMIQGIIDKAKEKL